MTTSGGDGIGTSLTGVGLCGGAAWLNIANSGSVVSS